MKNKPSESYKRYHAKKMKVCMEYKTELLARQTYPERLLHSAFKQLGRNPKKQKIFWNDKTFYILDLYFGDKKVCIEIDGESHNGKEDYDNKRDAYLLAKKGILTLRFTNSEVISYSSIIADQVLFFIKDLPKYNHNRRKFHESNEKRIMMSRDFRLNPPQRQ